MGVCSTTKGELSCGSAVAATEADTCKAKSTGVRDCRVNLGDTGGFDVARRPEGVLVKIKDRLELLPAVSDADAGPWLNLSGNDAENRSFLLRPAPAEICK
jgi:hypothetical protein